MTALKRIKTRHIGTIEGLQWSEDSNCVLSWGSDHKAQIWSIKDKREPLLIKGQFIDIANAFFVNKDQQLLVLDRTGHFIIFKWQGSESEQGMLGLIESGGHFQVQSKSKLIACQNFRVRTCSLVKH